ncbi:MAG: GGDEF domain-containing protein [Deltaproteobacteria bacterium]|nr:GGDEF domain-containing protein [Deltaproteobacteria bacterium]
MAAKDIAKELERLKSERDELERLNNELDARVLEIYSLYNISKVLNLSIGIEEIFNGTIDTIGKSLRIDEFCIMLLDETSNELVVRAWYPDPVVLPCICLKIGEGISGMAAKTGKPVLVQDVSKEPKSMFYKGAATNIGAFLCVPLVGKHGNILGVFNIHKAQPNSFNENDVKFFTEVAQQIAIAVEKAYIYKNARDISMRDELTGMYNRRYFFDYIEKELSRAKRYKKHFSVLMIDIDHFKNFNDKNGHLLGDDAIKQTAKLLIDKLRTADVVARYGGEEFICLLPETPNNRAVVVAEKLRKAVEGSKYKGGENQPSGMVSVTIGVATWPDDAKSAIKLIDYADKALYLGKSRGRNMVVSAVSAVSGIEI